MNSSLSEYTIRELYKELLYDEEFQQLRAKDLQQLPKEQQQQLDTADQAYLTELAPPPTLQKEMIRRYQTWSQAILSPKKAQFSIRKISAFLRIEKYFTGWRCAAPIALAMMIIVITIPVVKNYNTQNELKYRQMMESIEQKTEQTVQQKLAQEKKKMEDQHRVTKESWLKWIQLLKAEGKLENAKREQQAFEIFYGND